MPPNPRVAKAFRAMKVMGISEDKVKPVLKDLLKLYDKNWELIEEESYRALADAIFEREEAEAAGPSKKISNNEAAGPSKKIVNNEQEDYLEEEALANEETVRPLKRLRLRHQEGQPSSHTTSNASLPVTALIVPKEEKDELPETHLLNQNKSPSTVDSPQANAGNTLQVVASQSLAKNKGKQPVSPKALMVQERCDPSQPSGVDKSKQKTPLRTEPSPASHTMRPRDKGKGTVSPQTPSGGKRSVSERLSDAVRIKEPNVMPDIVVTPKEKTTASQALIKPKDEPITDEMPQLNISAAVIHPDPSNKGESSSRNVAVGENDGLESLELHSMLEKVTADGTAASEKTRNNGDLAIISADALGATGLGFSSLNSSVSPQFDEEVALPRTPLLPPPCHGEDDGTQSNNMDSGDDGEKRKDDTEDGFEDTNSQSLVALQQHQLAPELIRPLHDVIDIAKGHERVVITLVNEVNNEFPPLFYYIPQSAVFQNASVNFSLACIGDSNCCSACFGDCLSNSTPCACAHETRGEFAYTADGLVKEEFLEECISMNHDPEKHCQVFCKECPVERSKTEDTIESCKGHLVRKFITECWWRCGCNKQCGNRVVQRGITCNLQVFMTLEGKGWGLRTLEDLPKGAFVCEYVGEILTYSELFDRVSKSSNGKGNSNPVLLDADWGSKAVRKDEEALCLDATDYGNVARFINHRCRDSNLVEIPVQVEIPDHHYYHLAFFTTRKVNAMEELTWDYGIDFDDHDHLVKPFRCQCGSNFCRNIKRYRSKSASRG
ncbi:probable inactive histone-lysine N-methyltransferase SUVR1 isoform X3 [Olea europaea var. sylvestris]|uniref:Probable inactive histone-lysine N-methyltransferase SUVR2 n=1 Tax=Olea europaea subsp. europaea TaxID=158383 RepID=A0A8S0T0K5_OLEEU|nr:probable inactive histone-lysine N-methyltransferase SUVR1 isoform X3 [Olea europaea var. sylvestris]CAA2998119.1 probable inactive histone-lysine N-methyltransferase SUVR2 [Olea europaea subsp. europaea]